MDHFWATCTLRPGNQSFNNMRNNITSIFETHLINSKNFVSFYLSTLIAEMFTICLVPIKGPVTVKTLNVLPLEKGNLTKKTFTFRCPEEWCMHKHFSSHQIPAKIHYSWSHIRYRFRIPWRKGECMNEIHLVLNNVFLSPIIL